jgi:AraC-like DNA-binding protein
LQAGDAVALGQGYTVDIINTPGANGQYEAEWLVWDKELISRYKAEDCVTQEIGIASHLGAVCGELSKSIALAIDAIRRRADIPDSIARHRLGEVLIWMATLGARFRLDEPSSIHAIVREHLLSAPDYPWKAQDVAKRLATSEATLRRRLAAEGASLSELIADVRMSFGMQLLQSTDLPIASIALDVGYESASRFAMRFRKRFGFSPSAIRGHQRQFSTKQ